MDAVDIMKDFAEDLGYETLCEEIIRALPADTAMDVLAYIARNHDLEGLE